MELLDAVLYQDVEAVRELVAQGAYIHKKDEHGRTPLMRAAEWNGLASVRVLINLGARVNDRNDRGETALHIAVSHGHHEVACELLDHGADLSIRDQHGSTPLTTALRAPMSNSSSRTWPRWVTADSPSMAPTTGPPRGP